MEYISFNTLGIVVEYQFSSRKVLLIAMCLNIIGRGIAKTVGAIIMLFGLVQIAVEVNAATIGELMSPVFLQSAISAGGHIALSGAIIIVLGYLFALCSVEIVWRMEDKFAGKEL